jgi:trigger factor
MDNVDYKVEDKSSTVAVLSISSKDVDLSDIKDEVLSELSKNLQLPGFRKGKVPKDLAEKNLDPAKIQTEFLDRAVKELYFAAAKQSGLKIVSPPSIKLTKFVPYDLVEFEAEVEHLPDFVMPDYKKLKSSSKKVDVTEKDVDEVIDNLKIRMAEKKDVERKAKDGDQVWIDFAGFDKNKKPIKNSDGKDYPLALGSNTFIPGFEENLIGLKAGEEKSFKVAFPKDYKLNSMAGKEVTFEVRVNKVQEVVKPETNDDFAKKVGPFNKVKDLKDDIKKQLTVERQNQAHSEQEAEILQKLANKAKIELPKSLIDEQVENLTKEHQQNLLYRGQTMQEFYDSEGTDQEKYAKEVLEPKAIDQLKVSILLSEIAKKENIEVTEQELLDHMKLISQNNNDPKIVEELNKPEVQRNLASRLLAQKTASFVRTTNTKK